MSTTPFAAQPQRGIELNPISSFADGQSIYVAGGHVGHVYRVEFGAVRVLRLLANGRRQILAFYFAGDWFGLQNQDRHRSTAEAIGVTGVKSVSLQEDPHIWPGLLPVVLENFLSAQEHQLVIGRQSAIERVAAFMLEMSERSGGSHRFELSMPRADVSDYLGLTRETLSRSLTKLKNKGIIRLHGPRGVEILGFRSLQNLCL
ncbi:helix-turn-helix domain-containing protein [Bradyrhizobium sp. BRP14]|nr:helix-turn-helix domain-containing protein [Bradyrhizobium sp. BRP14]